MARKRTSLQKAIENLISAIQKEWTEVMGEPDAELAEEVLNRAHLVLQAAADGSLRRLLQGASIREYLDAVWVELHPSVHANIENVESAMREEDDA